MTAGAMATDEVGTWPESGEPIPVNEGSAFAPWYASFSRKFKCLRELREQPVAPELSGEFLALLRKTAVNNTVLFTVFNTHEREGDEDQEHRDRFFTGLREGGWVQRMVCQGVRPIVFVDTKASFEEFSKLGALPYYSETLMKAMHKILGDERSDVNLSRWTIAESLVRAGFSAFYVDLDVIWLGDLRAAYTSADADILFQYQGLPDEEFESTVNITELRRQAKKEREHICCQASFARICTGIMLMRATIENQLLAARVRARHLKGPCQNMQASVMELFNSCAPRGPVRCALFSHRDMMQWQTFAGGRGSSYPAPLALAKGEDGKPCTDGKPCSEAWLREHGPLLIHLDDTNDKVPETRNFNQLWPLPTCDWVQGDLIRDEL